MRLITKEGLITSLFATLILSGNLLAQSISKSQQGLVYRSEYYAEMPFWESPIVSMKGASPLTKEVAASRIHLQIDYDDFNRPIATHVKIGNDYKDMEGRLGSLYVLAPKTTISYLDNREIHRFFDRFDNRIKVMNDVYEKVYTQNMHGQNVKLEFFDEDGNKASDYFRIVSYSWEYLNTGKIIERRIDKEGNIVPLRGSFQFELTRMTFGANGYIKMLENINESGSLIPAACGASILNYYFDKQDRFKRWEVFDENNMPATGPSNTAGEVNEYEDYDLKSITFFNREGKPATHWSGAEKWVHEYDVFGNITRLSYLTNDDKPMAGARGYSSAIYSYSKDGRYLLYQQYHDVDDNLIEPDEIGYAKMVYARNEDGTIKTIKFYNAQGALSERSSDGSARIEYMYNKSHQLIKTEKFDVNGSLKE